MAYKKVNWENDGGSDVKPINQTNLNHMDEGIYTALQKDVGMVAFFCTTTAPNGWLVCDGRGVSRTYYKDLYNVIGDTFIKTETPSSQFNLPDLRGEFIRGWNNDVTGEDCPTDAGRTFGSKQEATSFKNGTGVSRYYADGEDSGSVHGNLYGGSGSQTAPTIKIRPNNIALLPCIYAGVFTN